MIRTIQSVHYSQLIPIWESSVKATHDFLKKEDFLYYKSQLPTCFEAVDLYGYYNDDNQIVAFMGVNEENMEMLFVDQAYRGQGIGRQLTKFAIEQLGVFRVDVNEQNVQAIDFYLRLGFKMVSRSNLDSCNRPYPILHMIYKCR